MEKRATPNRTRLLVCSGLECVSSGSLRIKEAFEKGVSERGLEDRVSIELTGCSGLCERGPVVTVLPEEVIYQRLTEKEVGVVVKEHLLRDRPVENLVYALPPSKEELPGLSQVDFFKHQILIALRNRGRIDPERIDEYIANDGYIGLAKALVEMTPEQVIAEVKTSGLRGRGGAGFPTGLKWEFCRKANSSDIKYIICNGDEGDPGAFMDRSLLEADPHAVLEGMIIGAYAIGAKEGFVYIRDEYPLALRRISLAIEHAEEYGLLGENILDSGLDFSVKVIRGGGAFVCGEETALMASIEGREGRPRPRPPFPAHKGLWGKPTNINNVETWANVAQIVIRGGEWYSNIGTEKSKGTKVFSLVGKVSNTGLVEVPMGIGLRKIIFDIGGGIPDGKRFKAVQSGGPSGGCIPEELIDLPVDFEELTKAGAIMGSGGLIVMDEDTCMVDVARYFVSFLEEESCGKCNPCREGIKRMREILTDIVEARGREGNIEILENLANVVKEASLCGLGATAPNPILTTIRYFRDEYEAHIRNKDCPARVCKAMIVYQLIAEKCTGCQRCLRVCPTGAISGVALQPHRLDSEKCVKCGACHEVCQFEAITVDPLYPKVSVAG
ncbi:MAG: NADH-quinone oxidoreductase subunit NuoF [Candidatus Zixiibacteriota bacterium]